MTIESHRGPWSLEMTPRIAFGSTRETVNINGSTTVTDSNGNPTTYQGGLLALGTNIGKYARDEFGVVPECDCNISYQITPRLQATIGYSFLYWTSVVRAGDQISTTLDSRNLPPVQSGAASYPAFAFQTASFWAQGINLGIAYRW
jgi:hypothetical protein